MERLAALRAQLRGQGAAGLQNLGQMGLQDATINYYRPRTPGLIESLSPVIGQIGVVAAGNYFNPC